MDAGGLSYNKRPLFYDVRYIIVSYSLRSDSGLSHVAIPAKRKGALSTQMRTRKGQLFNALKSSEWGFIFTKNQVWTMLQNQDNLSY